jgi:CspA family cold shock protein
MQSSGQKLAETAPKESCRNDKKLSWRGIIRPEQLTTGKKMPTGEVIWFDALRGYGFIKPDSGENDILVHLRELEKSHLRGLVEGQRVSFDIEPSPMNGKPEACNIRGPRSPVFR